MSQRPADVTLLQDGFVVLVSNAQKVVSTLLPLGYQVVSVDAARWTSDAELHRDVAAALAFPDYYGHNFDAMADVLRDRGAGWDRLVLVVHHIDAWAARAPAGAQLLLEVFASQARLALLDGRRWLLLAQSDDPALQFEPVGACPVTWHGVPDVPRP